MATARRRRAGSSLTTATATASRRSRQKRPTCARLELGCSPASAVLSRAAPSCSLFVPVGAAASVGAAARAPNRSIACSSSCRSASCVSSRRASSRLTNLASAKIARAGSRHRCGGEEPSTCFRFVVPLWLLNWYRREPERVIQAISIPVSSRTSRHAAASGASSRSRWPFGNAIRVRAG